MHLVALTMSLKIQTMTKYTNMRWSLVSGKERRVAIERDLTNLVERDDGCRRRYGAILFFLYLVDDDVILTYGMDNERLRVWTPSHVRRVVELDVHTQRFVFLLI